jgi:hypothetical protein
MSTSHSSHPANTSKPNTHIGEDDGAHQTQPNSPSPRKATPSVAETDICSLSEGDRRRGLDLRERVA